MKLYRTRTQEGYDYLMQKLEDEGYFWKGSKCNPTEQNRFYVYGDETIIRADTSDDTLTYGHTGIYPNEPIIEVSNLMEPDAFAIKIQERNHKLFNERQEILTAPGSKSEHNPIKPAHYNKGEIDLYESAYRTRPFNEFRAIMEFVAERYMKRDKDNRVEDLDKAIYTLKRLKEYEEMEEEE